MARIGSITYLGFSVDQLPFEVLDCSIHRWTYRRTRGFAIDGLAFQRMIPNLPREAPDDFRLSGAGCDRQRLPERQGV